jgi:ABC-type oligopeptide transport system substrate-binding subunit
MIVGQDSLLDLGDAEEEPLGGVEEPAGEGLPGLPPVLDPSRPQLPPAVAPRTTKSDEPVLDIVYTTLGGGRTATRRRVKLIPVLSRGPYPKGKVFEFMEVPPSGKGFRLFRPQGHQIVRIRYYEEHILDRAAEETGISRGALSQVGKVFDVFADPERAPAARNAITMLRTAIAEHDSAVQRRVRRGEGWAELREPLAQAWLNLQMSEILHLSQHGQVQMAIAACDRMLEVPDLDLRSQLAIRDRLEQLLLEPADHAMDNEDFEEARRLLGEFSRRYPFNPGSKANEARRRLAQIAQVYADRAVAEKNAKLLDKAAEVWPQLAGLEEKRRQLAAAYPVLHCAYSALPQGLSPLTARTLADRHAVSLMFESLVRWRQDARIGPHYAAQLAAGRPVPLPRGRQFELPRCLWSESPSGEPDLCINEDVFWTVQVMKKVKPFGYPEAWQRLVRDVNRSHAENPFLVSITLSSDHWQPLSLMDFKILPKTSFPRQGDPRELEAFERDPVGTGPYRLHSANRNSEVRFVANPFYRKPGLPRIREVLFHRLDGVQSHAEFLNGDIHLIYGVRPAQVVELRTQGRNVTKVPTPSVCFLAPNYRNYYLRNKNLRLALAHAIDREAILTTCFRPGKETEDHAALNGPFPVGSWAHNPRVQPFAPEQAAVFMKQAIEELTNVPELRLIYPDGDHEVGVACAEIKRQLEERLNLSINIDPVDPSVFYRSVVDDHSYDLAYWRHDFEDETFWIWPWFDPDDKEKGGANFMGYVADDDLRDLFHETIIHKQFAKIREAAHDVHDHLARNAVLIPLWQLDTYVAVSDQLRHTAFDPFDFYDGIENWELLARP